MADTTKLTRKDVKKEVKRIQKLPEYERERQMKALYNRVIDEIHSTSTRVNIYNRLWEKGKEAWRLLFCVMVFPKDYRKSIYKIWDKAFTNNVNYASANMVHMSGLPLPERAPLQVALVDQVLGIISGVKVFTLPVDRIINMGATLDCSGVHIGSIGGAGAIGTTVGGTKCYLTVEYEKEGETKHIVFFSTDVRSTNSIVKYYIEVKSLEGIESIRQEL